MTDGDVTAAATGAEDGMKRPDMIHAGKGDEIPPTVSEQIDENLKRLYSDAAAEELPPSLTGLLNALRAQDAQNAAGNQ